MAKSGRKQEKNKQLEKAISLRDLESESKNAETTYKNKTIISFKLFEIIKQIGEGAFGKVFKVKKKDTGVEYAMKCLKKRQLIKRNQLRYAVAENNILKASNHPFILKLNFSF